MRPAAPVTSTRPPRGAFRWFFVQQWFRDIEGRSHAEFFVFACRGGLVSLHGAVLVLVQDTRMAERCHVDRSIVIEVGPGVPPGRDFLPRHPAKLFRKG